MDFSSHLPSSVAHCLRRWELSRLVSRFTTLQGGRCEKCHNIIVGRLLPESIAPSELASSSHPNGEPSSGILRDVWVAHSSLAEVKSSIKLNECPMCAMLCWIVWENISPSECGLVQDDWHIFLRCGPHGLDTMVKNPLDPLDPLRPYRSSGSIQIYAFANDPAAAVLPLRPSPAALDGDMAFATVGHWIQIVGNPWSDGNVRLLETRRRGQYLALSYCWGRSRAVKTTTGNIRLYQNDGIALARLPKTIRDAVTITRRLGFAYLWVDAFCIIQDSVEDWRKEASKMCEVYRNAFLTICAAGAPDCNAGIFTPRPRELAMTVSLPISSKPHKGVAVLGPDYPQTQFIHEPLNCRAWTLQEGLLSWRAVSYGTDALSWNCQAQFMKTGPPDHQQDQISESLQSDHGISYDAVGWQQLIWDYSKRRITYPADKLAALSGIARLFHSRINVQYIAGFWEHTLPEALLWRCGTMCPDELTGDPPSNVPSWSWLAVSVGVVYFEDTRGPNKTRVVNWSIRPVGPDPFGQLESWSITLRGPIKHATLLSPETALGGSLLRDGWGSDGRRRYTRRGDTRDDSFGDVTTDFDIRNFSNLLQLPRLSGPSRNVACLLFKKGEHGSGIGRLLAGFDWNHKLHRSYRRVGLFDIERISWFDDAKIETITVV